jgi:hypothetical protein
VDLRVGQEAHAALREQVSQLLHELRRLDGGILGDVQATAGDGVDVVVQLPHRVRSVQETGVHAHRVRGLTEALARGPGVLLEQHQQALLLVLEIQLLVLGDLRGQITAGEVQVLEQWDAPAGVGLGAVPAEGP